MYFPNSSYLTCCQCLIKELEGFSTGRLLLGGDLNIPLNPLVDTSSGKTHIAYNILKRIKSLLNSLHPIDSWRFLHPEDKDLTFYSIPHNRDSRIDDLFISEKYKMSNGAKNTKQPIM